MMLLCDNLDRFFIEAYICRPAVLLMNFHHCLTELLVLVGGTICVWHGQSMASYHGHIESTRLQRRRGDSDVPVGQHHHVFLALYGKRERECHNEIAFALSCIHLALRVFPTVHVGYLCLVPNLAYLIRVPRLRGRRPFGKFSRTTDGHEPLTTSSSSSRIKQSNRLVQGC